MKCYTDAISEIFAISESATSVFVIDKETTLLAVESRLFLRFDFSFGIESFSVGNCSGIVVVVVDVVVVVVVVAVGDVSKTICPSEEVVSSFCESRTFLLRLTTSLGLIIPLLIFERDGVFVNIDIVVVVLSFKQEEPNVDFNLSISSCNSALRDFNFLFSA